MSLRYKSAILPEGALIEYIVVGGYVKVAAVDPISATEIASVGDPSTGRTTLARDAVKKLEYVLIRNRERELAQGKGQAKSSPARSGKRPENPSGWDI